MFSYETQNGEFDPQAGCQTESKSASMKTDSFNPSKAAEEDQVKTMELGSSVKWPVVEVKNSHTELF